MYKAKPQHDDSEKTYTKTNSQSNENNNNNLCWVGSEEDYKARLTAAQNEPQWTGIGTKTQLLIWHISDGGRNLKAWPRYKYGQFSIHDCYLILNTTTIRRRIQTPTSSSTEEEDLKVRHDLHTWVGKKSSGKIQGMIAYKMVEANIFLDSTTKITATKYREEQENESNLFLSYFNNRIQYIEYESQLAQHMDAIFQKHKHKNINTDTSPNKKGFYRLMKILSPDNDRPTDETSANHNNKTNSVPKSINSKWPPSPQQQYIENEKTITTTSILSTSSLSTSTATNSQIENNFSNDKFQAPILFQLKSIAGEKLSQLTPSSPSCSSSSLSKYKTISKEVLKFDRQLLDSKHGYLLDTGTQIYVWLGRFTTQYHSTFALPQVRNYLKLFQRPLHLISQTIILLEQEEPQNKNSKNKKRFEKESQSNHYCRFESFFYNDEASWCVNKNPGGNVKRYIQACQNSTSPSKIS